MGYSSDLRMPDYNCEVSYDIDWRHKQRVRKVF